MVLNESKRVQVRPSEPKGIPHPPTTSLSAFRLVLSVQKHNVLQDAKFGKIDSKNDHFAFADLNY